MIGTGNMLVSRMAESLEFNLYNATVCDESYMEECFLNLVGYSR